MIVDGNSVTITESIANEIIAQAFKILPERPAGQYADYKTVDAGQIYVFAVNYNGSEMNVGVGTLDNSLKYIAKIVWCESDGTEAGHWFVFVP